MLWLMFEDRVPPHRLNQWIQSNRTRTGDQSISPAGKNSNMRDGISEIRSLSTPAAAR